MEISIDDPAAVLELTAACDAYEAALMGNDLEAMDNLFWDSSLTLRYGVGENLYGIAAVRDFRTSRSGGSPGRDVVRREIHVFGGNVGVCNLEFRRTGATTIGRQSQTWIRTANGWKVASAHVSLIGSTS